MGRRRKRNLLDYVRLPDFDLDAETKKGIFIVFLLAIGAISLLGVFDLAGELGKYIKLGLTLMFGWDKWLLPIIIIGLGYVLYKEDKYEVKISNYIGLIIFVLSLQTLLFLFIDQDKWTLALSEGIGGGYIGWFFAGFLVKYTGLIVSFIISIALLVSSFILTFNTSLQGLFGEEGVAAKIFYPITYLFNKLFRREERDEDERDEEDGDENEDEEEEGEDEEENEDEEEEEGKDDEDEEEKDEEEGEDEEENEDEEEDPVKVPSKNGEESPVWWQPTGININLPINLLDGVRGKATSGDIKENQEIIRRTLMNFGIPAEMGEISVGPTVTQYTFHPAEGIKLSRITNLSNDFALSLAMHPIRIEAPIPGKSLVGVEVPNQSKAMVSLKEVLSIEDFKNRKSNLTIALGKDVAGKNWVDDITKMPHLLVAGATNSGKSVCLNAIIVSLLYANNPDTLRLIMVDPKRVELQLYNGIPHLLTPVITDVGQTINALKWCLNEMDRRFDMLSHMGKRDIKGYNESTKVPMPYIVFIIDELADLMVAAGRDIEGGVIRLSQMARAVGIHLILATQRPSVNIITGVIKANMPARIAFSVASSTDSRTILDTMGAEKLLGRGDMLFTNAEMSKPRRLQGAFVSDMEIKRIVRYIKDKSDRKTLYLENVVSKQKTVKGIGGYGMNGGGDDSDELFEEAKEIVINTGKASASFLQRKLRIGYARAASLLDAMEEAGVIGQGNGAKAREVLISREQYAAIANTGVSGMSLHRRSEAVAPDEFLDSEDDDDEADIPPVFKSEPVNKDEDDDEGREEEEEENEDEADEDDDENEEEQDEENDSDDNNESETEEKEEEEEEDDKEDLKKGKKPAPGRSASGGKKDIDFNKFFSR